jgi:MoxR-like ATPase
VLADEINRATPRTQSALLQAMEEREVTVEIETHPLPRPFMVLAAEPVELEGTFPLPEAQLDRFMLRIGIGYPALDEEADRTGTGPWSPD